MRLLLAVAAVAGLAGAVAAFTPAVQAATLTIDVVATGAEENPAVTGPGTAMARLTFDTDTNVLTYAVTVSGVSQTQVTAAHIHLGGDGTNGPVVYPLSLVPFTQVAGSINLTDEDVANLAAGDFYLNVHSLTNPGGFARAQIIFPGLTAEAAPGPVTPPSTGDAGLATASASTAWLAIAGFAVLTGAGGLVLARRRA
jgi:LPXTG-motif cell wall-anchored protein